MKKHTTFYITKELNNLMNFLIDREEIPKTLFLKRAIRSYLGGNRKIDPRILIKKHSHPDYIQRNELVSAYIDFEQWESLGDIAEEKGCNISQILFQALVEYCADILSQDSRGVIIREKE